MEPRRRADGTGPSGRGIEGEETDDAGDTTGEKRAEDRGIKRVRRNIRRGFLVNFFCTQS